MTSGFQVMTDDDVLLCLYKLFFYIFSAQLSKDLD